LAVTMVRPWTIPVAASHRSCGPIMLPAAASSAHTCTCARAVARSTGSNGFVIGLRQYWLSAIHAGYQPPTWNVSLVTNERVKPSVAITRIWTSATPGNWLRSMVNSGLVNPTATVSQVLPRSVLTCTE
jgi:hypothetical protein